MALGAALIKQRGGGRRSPTETLNKRVPWESLFSTKRRDESVCHALLGDPKFFTLLLRIDHDLAEQVRASRCRCGGALHRADCPRKPRGGPPQVRADCSVGALWHLDFHHGSRRVLTRAGQWIKPMLLGVIDDRWRLACYLQWYLDETAERLVHGLAQAFMKRGLPTTPPRSTATLSTPSQIPHGPTRSPQAWVEHEYHRPVHSEIAATPLASHLGGCRAWGSSAANRPQRSISHRLFAP